ncbi:MAG TPA: MaoC/PaaZ C-terminal domain-containing protein [Candidatus Binataceae bacterium]|nr:MaoC/PaaZ C-terminal domain-containing protein [Candidatus Binataceae bacterium]
MSAADGRHFATIEIGEALGPHEIVIGKARARAYAAVCGMGSGRFHDDEAARAEGLPGIIIPGNFSLGLLSKLVTDWLGAGPGRLKRIGTTYRAMVFPERRLLLQGFVTHLEPESRAVEIDVWIENEDNERLVIGTATAEFPPGD